MLGAIIGDIVGSRHEWKNNKRKDFLLFTADCHFTDDSLMTLAIAEAFTFFKGDWHDPDFQGYVIERMVKMGRAHSERRFWGASFYRWFMYNPKPYNSFGNGAAMRVSSVGWIAKSEEDVKYFSRLVTEVSHDHPEALKAAEAVAMAIYLGRTGALMEDIRARMLAYYPEIEKMTVRRIRDYCNVEDGTFITCQRSVPEAIVCFLESTSFEDAVRNAVSLGGDADTQGAITGSMAEAYYGVPIELEDKALTYLTPELEGIYHAFRLVKSKRAAR
ncbi:MAG: ADP-ribosylglycohydrolase family protein [Clostridia bacterium]|nr:ADP-ribosylglycohydrolase family protein [Clostridia bacterium]